MKRKYSGDPAFKAELDQVADDHAMQPLSAAEREKIATVVTRPFAPLHKHEEDCWGEPVKRMLSAPGRGGWVNVKVQICRRSGAIREVKE